MGDSFDMDTYRFNCQRALEQHAKSMETQKMSDKKLEPLVLDEMHMTPCVLSMIPGFDQTLIVTIRDVENGGRKQAHLKWDNVYKTYKFLEAWMRLNVTEEQDFSSDEERVTMQRLNDEWMEAGCPAGQWPGPVPNRPSCKKV